MSVFADNARFMEACGLTTTEDNAAQAELYYNLCKEEWAEWFECKLAGDEPGEADAVIDLLYVLIGYGLSRGWPMQVLWDEVQRSNMAKVGPDGRVRRRHDGKILKPEGWVPPDIKRVLAEHKAQREAERKVCGQ